MQILPVSDNHRVEMWALSRTGWDRCADGSDLSNDWSYGMTVQIDEAALGSALAMLWQRHRQTNLDRIAVLEATTAEVLRSTVDDDAVCEAAGQAHKLAGSLGTFGFAAAAMPALEAEYLLRQPMIDGRLSRRGSHRTAHLGPRRE